MRTPRSYIFYAVTLLMTASAAMPSYAQSQEPEQLSRGEYITKKLAMCVQCHSPRNAAGELEETMLFRGASMPVSAPASASEWASQCPNLRGFLGYTDEEAVYFLQTGIRRDGTHPRSPMPPFRMNKEDAEAVVKYLKSLK